MNDINMFNIHPQNNDIASEISALAAAQGLGITRYQTSSRYCGFIGRHSYAIFTMPADGRPFGIRSKRVIDYTAAKYSRYGRPSISGERAALKRLANKLAAA